MKLTVLEDHDRQGAAWMKIEKYLTARLEKLRAKNDASKSIEETEKLRGRIEEIKHMLALDDPDPETESSDPDY